MSSTQLQLVNSILRRLREPAVTSVASNDYSKMVAEYLNQAKQEVEDAWDWLHLRNTITVATVASTFRYTLTGAGKRWRLLRDWSTQPPGWDVWNDSTDAQLTKAPSSAWMTRMLLNNSVAAGEPLWFDVNGQSSGDPQVDLYPVPNGVWSLKFNMVIPQADFALDGTDNSTELVVPEMPVLLRAYDLCRNERGEDGSTSPSTRQKEYQDVLWTHIMREMNVNNEETVATVS